MRWESGSGKVQLIVPGIQPCAAAPATRAEDAHDLSLEVGLQLITEGLHLCFFDNLHPQAEQPKMIRWQVLPISTGSTSDTGASSTSAPAFLAPTATASAIASVFLSQNKNDRYFLSHLDLLTGNDCIHHPHVS